MSNAVSAQGTKIYISAQAAPASPTGFTKIAEVNTFSREGDRPEIDVSSLDSTAREYRLGLQDNGTLSFECNCVFTDAGQDLMVAALSSPGEWEFKIEYPDATVHLFRGLVKKFDIAGGVDQVLKRNAQIRLTGAITEI